MLLLAKYLLQLDKFTQERRATYGGDNLAAVNVSTQLVYGQNYN